VIERCAASGRQPRRVALLDQNARPGRFGRAPGDQHFKAIGPGRRFAHRGRADQGRERVIAFAQSRRARQSAQQSPGVVMYAGLSETGGAAQQVRAKRDPDRHAGPVYLRCCTV
jgi:hypothetical protein